MIDEASFSYFAQHSGHEKSSANGKKRLSEQIFSSNEELIAETEAYFLRQKGFFGLKKLEYRCQSV